MAKQTGSIDLRSAKQAHDDAKKTATTYIAEINNDGIFVHQNDTNKNGETPSALNAYGVHISDDVDIIRGGQVVASYGQIAQIGPNSGMHVDIDTNGLTLKNNTQVLGFLKASEINFLSGGLSIEVEETTDEDDNDTYKVTFSSPDEHSWHEFANFTSFSENVTIEKGLWLLDPKIYDPTAGWTLEAAGSSYIESLQFDEIVDNGGDTIENWSDLVDVLPGLLYRGSLSDLNDADENGVWKYDSSADHRPPISAGGTVINLKYSSSYMVELAFPNDSTASNRPRIYLRRYSSGWATSWYQVRFYRNAVPTFTTPTIYSSRAKDLTGGYYKDGDQVYVQLGGKCNQARSGGARQGVQYFSGFPTPAVTSRVALSVVWAAHQGVVANITSLGNLFICPDENLAFAVDDEFYITGTYFTSD